MPPKEPSAALIAVDEPASRRFSAEAIPLASVALEVTVTVRPGRTEVGDRIGVETVGAVRSGGAVGGATVGVGGTGVGVGGTAVGVGGTAVGVGGTAVGVGEPATVSGGRGWGSPAGSSGTTSATPSTLVT